MSAKPKDDAIAKMRSGVLAAQLEKLAEEDVDIIRGANAARNLRDWQIEDAERDLKILPKTAILDKYGLTKEQLAVAIDARRNPKDVPFYLKMVDARSQLRWRDGTGEKTSKPAAIILAGGSRKPEVTEKRGTVVVNLGGDDGK